MEWPPRWVTAASLAPPVPPVAVEAGRGKEREARPPDYGPAACWRRPIPCSTGSWEVFSNRETNPPS